MYYVVVMYEVTDASKAAETVEGIATSGLVDMRISPARPIITEGDID